MLINGTKPFSFHGPQRTRTGTPYCHVITARLPLYDADACTSVNLFLLFARPRSCLTQPARLLILSQLLHSWTTIDRLATSQQALVPDSPCEPPTSASWTSLCPRQYLTRPIFQGGSYLVSLRVIDSSKDLLQTSNRSVSLTR
jgi:hypothetical protein